MAISGDNNFTHMERDHVGSLLALTLESLSQLDKSFKELVAGNDSHEQD